MKKRLISLLIILCATVSAGAFSTSIYRGTSLLNAGHWVKISTDSEGIYQLTYDQLRDLGFKNPEHVQVYGYSAIKFSDNIFSQSAPDDMTPTPTLHTDDGRILFYGCGAATLTSWSTDGYNDSDFIYRRNYYDTKSYYFLSDSYGIAPIPHMPTITASESYEPLRTHLHLEFIEDDIQNPLDGGVGYHGAELAVGSNTPVTFRMRHYQAGTHLSGASFTSIMAIGAATQQRISMSAGDNMTVTGSYNPACTQLTDGDFTRYSLTRNILNFIPSSDGSLDDTEVTFTITVPNANIRYIAPERYILRYPRANVLDDTDSWLPVQYADKENRLGQQIIFTGAAGADDIMVWDVNDLSKIRAYRTTYDETSGEVSYVLSESYNRRNIAFRPSAQFDSPHIEGGVAQQNLHGSEVPDMLIITTAAMIPEAERLAEAHRQYQGITVNVVDQEQIFNEFSSGARDAMAYRRLAKMYHDRDASRFKYLMLFGPCSYDNRGLEQGDGTGLITYQNTDISQSRNIITNYAADSYFAMLSDNYQHSNISRERYQIAVGRVPAMTEKQAAAYVNKAIARLSGESFVPGAYARAVLIAGEGDRNTHLQHSTEVADTISSFNPGITLVKLPLQLYPNTTIARNILIENLSEGVGYMTYSGHGDPDFIGTFHLWDRSYNADNPYDHQPFVMFSSCDQFAFDRPRIGLVEDMLYAPRGGVLGGVAACRSVYISHNQTECVPVAQAYASCGPGATYGDIYRAARDIIIDRYNAGEITNSMAALPNCLNYNLAGDPAIPVGAPGSAVTIESVDGTAVADNAAVDVAPFKPIHIKGVIAEQPGFNGSAKVRVLAVPMTSVTNNIFNESNYESVEVEQGHSILATVEAEVHDGSFEAVVVLPSPDCTGLCRVVVDAYDPATRIAATCNRAVLNVLDSESNAPESPADPVILSFTAGDAAGNGGEVAPDVKVTALIDAGEAGLAFGDAGIATRPSLTLDGINNIPCGASRFSAAGDGTMTLNTMLEGLTDGRHTLTLTVTNSLGGVDRATIDFVVVTRKSCGTLTVEETPARTEATITLDTAVSADNRFVITDPHGRTVFTAAGVSFPYRWNLTDTAGAPVADGRYTATLLQRDGADYSHVTSAPIVVFR